MIQDIFPHTFNNHYFPNQHLEDNDFVLHYKNKALLLKSVAGHFEIPRKKDFPELNAKTNTTFLFKLDEISCFMIWDEVEVMNPAFSFQEIATYRSMRPPEVAWICVVGFQLFEWYTLNKYCGKCGNKFHHKSDERALLCPTCGNVLYPKISPAVIVAIICKDKILLAANSSIPGRRFSLIAGFVDAGETIESTVIREVREEVGLEVKNIRYYASQPWSLSSSLMLGFVAEADDRVPLKVDTNELLEAAWYKRGELPNHSLSLSIAGEMIEKFERDEL